MPVKWASTEARDTGVKTRKIRVTTGVTTGVIMLSSSSERVIGDRHGSVTPTYGHQAGWSARSQAHSGATEWSVL